jgi:hypothetical protein
LKFDSMRIGFLKKGLEFEVYDRQMDEHRQLSVLCDRGWLHVLAEDGQPRLEELLPEEVLQAKAKERRDRRRKARLATAAIRGAPSVQDEPDSGLAGRVLSRDTGLPEQPGPSRSQQRRDQASARLVRIADARRAKHAYLSPSSPRTLAPLELEREPPDGDSDLDAAMATATSTRLAQRAQRQTEVAREARKAGVHRFLSPDAARAAELIESVAPSSRTDRLLGLVERTLPPAAAADPAAGEAAQRMCEAMGGAPRAFSSSPPPQHLVQPQHLAAPGVLQSPHLVQPQVMAALGGVRKLRKTTSVDDAATMPDRRLRKMASADDAATMPDRRLRKMTSADDATTMPDKWLRKMTSADDTATMPDRRLRKMTSVDNAATLPDRWLKKMNSEDDAVTMPVGRAMMFGKANATSSPLGRDGRMMSDLGVEPGGGSGSRTLLHPLPIPQQGSLPRLASKAGSGGNLDSPKQLPSMRSSPPLSPLSPPLRSSPPPPRYFLI